MRTKKGLMRYIALFIVFTIFLGSINLSFGALGRVDFGWHQRQPEGIATNSNALLERTNIATGSNAVVLNAVRELPIYDLVIDLLDEDDSSIINTTIKPDAYIKMFFSFKVAPDAKAGDFVEITLPEEIEIFIGDDWILYVYDEACSILPDGTPPHGENNHSIEDSAHDECQMFHVVYQENLHGFKLTFTDYVEKMDDVWAYFYVEGWFNQEIIEEKENDGYIVFGYGDEEIEVWFDFEEEEDQEITIEKESIAVWYDQSIEDYIIQWKVMVNSENVTISDFRVEDKLMKDCLEYIAGSTVINGIEIDETDIEQEWLINYDAASQAITWHYQGGTKECYTIVFQTRVTSFDNANHYDDNCQIMCNGEYIFVNQAAFINEDLKIDSNEVEVMIRLIPMTKVGEFDLNTKSIAWTLEINPENWVVTSSSLMFFDEMEIGLQLDKGSVKLEPASEMGITVYQWDDNYFELETEPNNEWKNDNIGSRMSIKLGELLPSGLQETYYLTYITYVDFEFFELQNEEYFNNYAYLTIRGSGIFDVELPSVGKGGKVESHLISLEAGTVIYQDTVDAGGRPTIPWTITINANRNNYRGKTLILEDIDFTEGLKILPQTVQVGAGRARSNHLGEINYPDLSDNKLIVTFADCLEDVAIITFKTMIDDLSYLKKDEIFESEATLWLAAPDEPTIIGADSDYVKVNANYLKKNGSYNYTTQQFAYELIINSNEVLLNGSTNIIDELPDGLRVVGGQAGITITGAGLTAGQYTYQLEQITDNNVPLEKLTIDFTNLDTKVTVKFLTEFTEEFLTRIAGHAQQNQGFIVRNEAQFWHDEVGKITAVTSGTVTNRILVKESSEVNGDIQWSVHINSNGWLMEGLAGKKLYDTLQEGLVLATDTIELYEAVPIGGVGTNGGTLKKVGESLTITSEHVDYNPQTREFVFTFPDYVELGKAYILEFVTDVLATGDYENIISMEVGQEYRSIKKQSITVSDAGGDGSGTRRGGTLQILKIDETINEPLANAKFMLTDYLGMNYYAVSNQEGIAEFYNVAALKPYTLQEIEAPEGYFLNTQEQIITVNAGETKTITMTNRKISGNIEFYKISGSQTEPVYLADAAFQLKGESGVYYGDMVTTDITGRVRFENVLYGEYEVWEIVTPKGYQEPVTFVGKARIIEDGVTVGLDNQPINDSVVKNNKIQQDVIFYKVDDNGSYLAGATFSLTRVITDSLSNLDSFVNYYQADADSNGKVIFKSVDYGTYEVREIRAPEGYQKIQGVVGTITVDVDGFQCDFNNEYKFSDDKIANTKIAGQVEISKYNEEMKLLPDATFVLRKADNNSKHSYGPKTTGNDGKVFFANVEYGTYDVVEIKAPKGYILPEAGTAIAQVTIDEANNGEIIYLDVQNQKITGSVIVKKVGKDGVKPLAGAIFELIRVDQVLPSGFDQDDGPIRLPATNENGEAEIVGIEYGTYEVYEIVSPVGYVRNETLIDVIEITKNHQVVRINQGIGVKNEPLTGRLQVTKTSTNGLTKLKGAKFDLYQVEDVNGILDSPILLKTDLVTDEKGEIAIGSLEYGRYYLSEVEAPTGYRLPTNPITYFEISSEDEIVSLTITNARKGTGGGTTPTTAPDASTAPTITESEDLTTVPWGRETPPTDIELPPGYIYEYDEERGEWLLIDSNGVPLGWFNTPEAFLSSVPKTSDNTPIVLLLIVLVGAVGTIIICDSHRWSAKRKKK